MKYFLILLTLAFNLTANAQDDKTVTLTVSGQGKTQDEAKQNALRNAIEQAFGTFISSKTEILNDNLVKDEIVSVSNGNIQKFDVISEVQIPNGDYATTLKATVSITKLTSFVESKGVVVEFKGNILAANIKQQILNEQNETKSIQNIANTCKEILDKSCDFEIVRGEPKQKSNDNNKWAVPIRINVKFNKNIEQFSQYLFNSINGLSMSPDEVSQYKQLGKTTYKIALGDSSIGGITDNIEFLISLAKSNTNLNYKIIFGGVLFESDDIRLIKKEFKNLNTNGYIGYRGLYKIEYFDKSIKPIFYFRSLSTVVSIIDLISYTKHSILNFEVTNGLDIITPVKLVADINSEKWDGNGGYVYEKDYDFKIIIDPINPIFNSRCAFFLYSGNSPNGIFAIFHGKTDHRNRNSGSEISLYETINKYNTSFYYSGGQNLYKSLYLKKYGFLVQADGALPKDIIGKNELSHNGYMAVISLFDYKSGDKNVVSYYYNDVLTLSDIEKVQEYKINPITITK